MPSPDPIFNPTTSQGPFSRYLDPQTAVEGTEMTQRPSGFMGTTGKLAMFGGQILKGLMQGKMQQYARREQEKYEQFEKKAREVQAFQALPDVPDEAKAQAALYLQQGWATLTKEQAKEAKKNHDKDGHGEKVLGFFSGIADKLAGQTPAEHKVGGEPWDKLNSMLAEYHSGGPKYSKEAQLADIEKQIATAAKPYAANYDWAGTSGDEKVNAPLARLFQLDPKRAQFRYGQLRESMTPPSVATQDALINQQILKGQPAPGATPSPSPTPGATPQSAQTPTISQTIAPGSPRLVPHPDEQVSPMSDKSTSGPSGPAEPEVFRPHQIPGGPMVATPEQEEYWLRKHGGKEQRAFFKRPGPNGTTERREGWVYSGIPGYIKDVYTGQPMDLKGWQPTTAGDKDPLPAKPDKPKVALAQGPGNTAIPTEVTPGHPFTPYHTPERPRVGRSVDPVTEELKKDRVAEEKEKQEATKDKKDTKSLVSKIMSDIYADSQKGMTKDGVEMTPLDFFNQRINDFAIHYKGDPRFRDNFADIQEALLKRKGEMEVMSTKEARENSRKQADWKKNNPGNPYPGSGPAQPTPQPGTPPLPQQNKPPQQPPTATPKVGEVRKGYRFKGGDPADKSNWVKVTP